VADGRIQPAQDLLDDFYSLMHVTSWHRWTPESKFTKFGEEMSIGLTPNHAKFCGDPTGSARYIRDRKFVLPEKLDQSSPKFFRGCCSPTPLTNLNFVAIGFKM